MSAPADVLAALEREAQRFAHMSQVDACLALHDVRDVVVELIEALRDMRALHGRMMREANHAASCYQAETFAAMNNAPIRADAVLDRATGGAA